MADIKPPRNWRRVGLTAIIVLCAVGITLLWVKEINTDRRFESGLWKESGWDFIDPNPRLDMVNDLQRNILSRGMKRTVVESLLGTQITGFTSNDDELTYRLGRQTGTGSISRHGQVVQSDGRELWLVLKFSNRDRLIEWQVVTR